jgi:hypothetical protein
VGGTGASAQGNTSNDEFRYISLRTKSPQMLKLYLYISGSQPSLTVGTRNSEKNCYALEDFY